MSGRHISKVTRNSKSHRGKVEALRNCPHCVWLDGTRDREKDFEIASIKLLFPIAYEEIPRAWTATRSDLSVPVR